MPKQAPFSGKGFSRILAQAASYFIGTAKIINNAIHEQFHATVSIHSPQHVSKVVKFANNRANTRYREKNKSRYS